MNLVRVDRHGEDAGRARLVGTLQKDDFEIYDNGVRQEIAVFEHQTEQPLSVALLVDTSGSTAKDLKYEVDSASRFCTRCWPRAIREDARRALHLQLTRSAEQQPFTHETCAALERASEVAARRGRHLAVRRHLSRGARRWKPRQGRKVIVVVTDGGDTTSKPRSHRRVESGATGRCGDLRRSWCMPITNDAGRNIGGENA